MDIFLFRRDMPASEGLYRHGLDLNSHWHRYFLVSSPHLLFIFILIFSLACFSFGVRVRFGPFAIFSLFISGIPCFVNLVFCLLFHG